MISNKIYKIPTIEINSRDDLIKLFLNNPPNCVFEDLQEVLNPVGLQWNYTLTAKIDSDSIGTPIVCYRESVFEKPENSGILANWLKDAIPSINEWYKGILRP